MREHSYIELDSRTGQWREVTVVRLVGLEPRVLELLGKRLERQVIAARLGITRRYVDQICSVLVEKLGCTDVEALTPISIQVYHTKVSLNGNSTRRPGAQADHEPAAHAARDSR
jgi:DNA-binding NarL/FixJ family response regulator